MFTLAASGLAAGLIAIALAVVARRRLQSLQTALQEVSAIASQSTQQAEGSAVSASSLRLTAQRSQEMAELSAKASQESAEAAHRIAAVAAQSVAEALRSAEAAAQSASASLNSAQSAARAVAAAEASLRIAEHNAEGERMAAKAAESAAGSALRSAEAAGEAAQSNRALVELGKRAWVHATEFRVSLKTQGNENSTLEVRIANLGNTPARELKVTTNFHIENEVPDELPLKPRVSSIVLGPGVSFSISHFLHLSPADIGAIGTGKRILLASGQADYVDVFGAARQTRWCAVYNYNGNSFTPATRHNLTT